MTKRSKNSAVYWIIIMMSLVIFMPLSLDFFTPQGAGSNGTVITVSGGAQDDHLGWNISAAGDLNRDGFDDFIIGAPGYDNERGRAYIFFGGDWLSGAFSDSDANITITGGAQGDRFAWDVSGAFDMNKDGFDDVVISAPGNNSETGVVYIFFGNDTTPSYLNVSEADVVLMGGGSGDEFGASVSYVGDVNNDGYDDVILGSPGNNSDTGSAYIFFGGDKLTPKIDVMEANFTMFGENIGDRFGFSVSNAGDVNNDNFDDVMVGAFGVDRVYIYFGGDPMNSWLQTTQADFDSAETNVHINVTNLVDGEARLETFLSTKAMMAYYNGTVGYENASRSRTWDQEAWGPWGNTSISGSDENYWFVLKSGTVRKNEKILAVSDSGLDLNVQVSDGLSWGPILELSDVLSNSNYSSYDLAYESISGDALLVYYNVTSGDLFPKYKIWNGSSWSAEQDALEVGTADIYWVVLASNPNSDEILMVTLDANSHIWAQVWDGDTWGNNQSIETAASQTMYQCFDVTYESQSGNGFIAWSANLADLRYKRWIGDWTEPEGGWGKATGIVNFVKLAADTNTNYILGAQLNDAPQINATVWNGTEWGTTVTITDGPEVVNCRCFDLAWESRSDREGLIVYGENNDAPSYKTVNGSIINLTGYSAIDANPSSGDPNWIALKSDFQSNDIMMMYLVYDGLGAVDDIGTEFWNGTGWVKEQNIELDSTRDNAQRFDLAFTDTSGYLISSSYDAKIIAPWGRIRWTDDIPQETELKIRTRTSPDGSTWSGWSDWCGNGDRISSPANRYIQYQVWFETMNITLSPTLSDVTIELNHADLIINGTPGEGFGWSMSGIGDMDGDGNNEVIIGAPQNNTAQGVAYVFNGSYITSKSAESRYISLFTGDKANITLTGEFSGDQFGYSVSFAGDLNIDGDGDFVVGAPGAFGNGSIYVFFGNPSMNPAILAANSDFFMVGENVTDGFGYSVSCAGNLDNDTWGYDEMIIGAPYHDYGGNMDSGRIYVLRLLHQPDLLLDDFGDDEYQNTPFGLQVNLTIIVSDMNSTWEIILQNDGNIVDTFDFGISSNMLSGWTWELRDNKTWLKMNHGDSVILPPGGMRNFTLNISSSATASGGDESWIIVNVTSQNNTNKRDSIEVVVRIEDTPPNILDTTSGIPTTGELFQVSATVTDDLAMGEVHLYYWFNLSGGGTLGPFIVTMDPGYLKDISIPVNAIRLHYNISAKDASNNWNETGETTIDVQDNDKPSIIDTTAEIPTTGGTILITANAFDNIQVDGVYLYYWFELFGGGIEGPNNITMGPGYSEQLDILTDAVKLYYNIYVKDASGYWDETGLIMLDVIDDDNPMVTDTTVGIPETGSNFDIKASASDNIDVNGLHLFYWFETVSGPTSPLNKTMNNLGGGNYNFSLPTPLDAIVLHYNLSANDTTNNWDETGDNTLNVLDNIKPEISDTTIEIPSTGDQFIITAQAIDNIDVPSLYLYYFFDTTGGLTAKENQTMNFLGGGFYDIQITIPSNAITLYYNISANDTTDNWNETGEKGIAVEDDDPPIISGISVNPSVQEAYGSVNITANIADEIGTGEVWINISLPDGSYINQSMKRVGGNLWFYNRAYSILGSYSFSIGAFDTTGNPNKSGSTQFTITPLPETVDYILIRSGPYGTGKVLDDKAYNLYETDRFYAAAYNYTYDYLWDVEVNWLSTSPFSGSLNPSTGFSTDFTAVGIGSGKIYAIFDLLNHSLDFEVIISQNPVITGIIPNIEICEDYYGLYQLDLTDNASDPQSDLSDLKWRLSGYDPSIIIINNETKYGEHIFSFVTRNDKYGNMEVTYYLIDRDGNQASQKAWINVSPVNDPPTIGNCPNIIVHFDSPFTFDYSPYIHDVDNLTSDLTLICDDNSYATVSGFLVTYNYPESMLGERYVTLTVSDGLLRGSDLIEVKITSNNPPESVKRLPDVTLYENETKLAVFDLDEYFSDPDDQSLTMSCVRAQVKITINEDHTVDFTAPEKWSGSEKVIFRAKDPMGAIKEQAITVTVIPVNDPPVIKPLPILSVRFNLNYTFDLRWYISDEDNEIGDLLINTSNPDNVTVVGTKLILLYPKSWDGQDYPYSVPLTVFVSDGINTTYCITTVKVDENFPPELSKIMDDLFFYEDEKLIGAYDLDDYFFDPNDDPIYYTYGNEFIEVIIHENNTIDFIPPANWSGSELIVIRAADIKEAFYEDMLWVTVIPVNDAPQIADIPPQVGIKGQEWILDLTEYISDIDSQLFNLSVFVNSSYVKVVGHVLIFCYPENITEDTIWITVSDGELETSAKVDITINPPEIAAREDNLFVSMLPTIPLLLLVGILSAFVIVRRGRYTMEDLLLITRSGLLIKHVGIIAEPKAAEGEDEVDLEEGIAEEKDEDLIASMFVAVQDFVKDSFGGEGDEDLKRLDYGEKTVLIQRGQQIILAAFISGQASKPLFVKMKGFVDDIEERYEDELEDWVGIDKKMAEFEALLTSFLEGKYEKESFENIVKGDMTDNNSR